MRECFHCKSTSSFYPNDSLCKACRKRYEWERSVLRKLKAIEYKGGKCMICGYNKYYGSLVFHHRNPAEKEFSWPKLRLRSWDDVIKELDKCDLLCRNCHGEVHKIEIGEIVFPHKEHEKMDRKRVCKYCKKDFEYKYYNKSQVFCCKDCYTLGMRKVERPSKEDLAKMIENMTWTAIAKQYGVGRKAVKEWAIKYGII